MGVTILITLRWISAVHVWCSFIEHHCFSHNSASRFLCWKKWWKLIDLMSCVRLSPLEHTIFGINGNRIPQMSGFDLLASAPIGGSTNKNGLPDLSCLLWPLAWSMGASPWRHVSYSDLEKRIGRWILLWWSLASMSLFAKALIGLTGKISTERKWEVKVIIGLRQY